MTRTVVTRRRPKVGATVDPQLLGAVDAWLRTHPDYDRSRVIDEALQLWHAREQHRAMEVQYAGDQGVDPDEWAAMKALQRAAAMRQFQRRGRD